MRLFLLTGVALVLSLSLSAGESEAKIPSGVLMDEARVVIGEILELQKSDRRLPHDISAEEIRKRLDTAISNLKKAGVFDVSAAQEERFKKGTFDDADATTRLKAAIKILQSINVDMPVTTVYAMRQLEGGKLRGARLEICARLAEHNIEQLKALGGGKGE
ncbi:MAG TPA: hypothetical protein VGP72_19005 [Planctomycetota bacterium]